eukprot:TRINITY_DN3409_c0_g2_i1.p1 TRINITY_DN3409_c0_g2~~TRINITY_DN3409_c0_g2_i1.p1  ORF type:complete len:561 (+),score=104.06 TRINITY_DN3409_c0_g2_i1:86-1768(+)
MGNKAAKAGGDTASASFSAVYSEAVEERIGKVGLAGRYHTNNRKVTDDYVFTSQVLGSGLTGSVRLAACRRTSGKGQKFAVKSFKLSGLDAEERKLLTSEVEIFLQTDHPHITRLFDVYETADQLHLIMECMEGGELFDRVTEKKRFSECDAADATYQMLLAISYLHARNIVHRDLKLENFLYDRKGSNHLKLIDFGFSRIWDPKAKMQASLGTLSYVAPEVLAQSYTSQCDMWSLGVIVFIMLAGYMPFSGPDSEQSKNIMRGRYVMKPHRWDHISADGKRFTKLLLQVDPEQRLTAQAALKHPFIVNRRNAEAEDICPTIVDGLRSYRQASKFRRTCLQMMAWSLSNEDRAKVRGYFVAMDKNKQGTITLCELKSVLTQKFNISDREARDIFEALDTNSNAEIHYSDFLAAMVSTRINLHDDLLMKAFKRFDRDDSGYITEDNLREILGESYKGEEIANLMKEADLLKDNRISYKEFVAYLREHSLDFDDASNPLMKMIDKEAAASSRQRILTRKSGSLLGCDGSDGLNKGRSGILGRGLIPCGANSNSCAAGVCVIS